MTMLDAPPTFIGVTHPYADRWPMRTADELEALAESIRTEGQDLPIILTPEGVLVDGRNRLRACEIANVTPLFEVREDLTDEDAITRFIWRMNGDLRRHMSKGQTAMLAALAGGSQVLLSNNVGTSQAYISRAAQVIQWCDEDTVEAVIRGVDNDGISLNDAYALAQEIKATVQAEEIAARKAAAEAKKEEERRAAQLADLREHRPDLAELVDDDRLPLDEALSLRSREAAKERARAEAEQQAIRNLVNDAHLAFTIISTYQHPETIRKIRANWAPQVRDWTAADLLELASILTAVADTWENPA